VAAARAEFELVIAEFLRNHADLTDVELLRMLTNEMDLTLKYALRKERHGGRTDLPAEYAEED